MTDRYQTNSNDDYVRAVHDRGLGYDLGTMSRRGALGLFGGSLLGLAACAAPSTSAVQSAATSSDSTATPAASSAGECVAEIPDETAGPYPGDGSNGANALTQSGIVRSDIRSSFGGPTGTASGVPLTIELSLLNLADACKPYQGAAVYLWHCDANGDYSMYSSAIVSENYLRGVQEADADGLVRFTSIFPGCYAGRWPHIHFEVYASLADATAGTRKIVKTSQLALPEDACRQVYAESAYSSSVGNLARTSLSRDNVFGEDSGARQLATMTGSNAAGWKAALRVAVD